MTDEKLKLIKSLGDIIPELTAGQLHWLQRISNVFQAKHTYQLTTSDLFDETILQNFGDAMRVHQSFSNEPFTKDKFEYVFVKVLNMSSHKAELSPKGHPGHDATLNGVRLSFKTQADRGIKSDYLWISKFMELGKGKWGNEPSDLEGLRNQFLKHLESYDRIFSLRNLSCKPYWNYELVEIPKDLLQKAKTGTLEMKTGSRQFPKPGYCYVKNDQGETLFDLYFDGGGERKLQIKNLAKKFCRVHATWDFFIPSEEVFELK